MTRCPEACCRSRVIQTPFAENRFAKTRFSETRFVATRFAETWSVKIPRRPHAGGGHATRAAVGKRGSA